MNNTPSVINKINYAAKIVNAYIAFEFDYWPQNPRGNFVLKKLAAAAALYNKSLVLTLLTQGQSLLKFAL